MLFDTRGYRLFLRPGSVDFRKGSNSLAQLVEQEMELSPFDKCMFLFCSRERDKIKILLWEDNGFWLLQKSLQKGKFPWPRSLEKARAISNDQLMMLLAGIDCWNILPVLKYDSIG
jgi:transposase